jgi:phage-related tail fiber protein
MVQDVYAMMTQSLSRDGQGGMRSNLDMSGFRIANLAAPTLATDAARFGDTEPVRTFAIRGTAYTALVGDKNSVQRFTATVTCSLDPAATLGNGWYFTVQAAGGNVTIDPSGAETINGAATIVIPDGYSTLVWCNGTTFYALQDYASVQTLATPSGMISVFANSTAPTGWLKANGSAVARATYPNIDAAIYVGDANNATALFGYRCTNAGSPSTSRSTTGEFIVLPDLRGEFVRGWDDSRGVDSGRAFGTSQSDDFKSHNHTELIEANIGGSSSRPASGGPFGQISSTTGMTGGDETRPRNVSLLFCVKI